MRKPITLALAALLVLGLATARASTHHSDRHPLILAGKVSVYGPPYEGAGTTATGESSAQPGFASRLGPFGRSYCVTLHQGRLHAILRRIDYGPASWTGRVLDLTGSALSRFRGHGSITTDATAHARLLPRKRGPAWRCGQR